LILKKAKDLKAKPKDTVTGNEESLNNNKYLSPFRMTAIAALSVSTLLLAKAKFL
jgi:hypothetical protein